MGKKLKSIYPKNFPIGPGPIDEERLQLILERELKDWKVVYSHLPENPFDTRAELFREYHFSDFNAVIEYMTKVAVGCQIYPHHPRWENTWKTLKVWLTTWDIDHVISYKDIMLARYMDKHFEAYEPGNEDPLNIERKEKDRNDFIRNVRKEIAEDNIEKAFEKLNEYATLNREHESINDLTIVMGQLNRIRRSERIGEISRQDADIQYNKIRKANPGNLLTIFRIRGRLLVHLNPRRRFAIDPFKAFGEVGKVVKTYRIGHLGNIAFATLEHVKGLGKPLFANVFRRALLVHFLKLPVEVAFAHAHGIAIGLCIEVRIAKMFL